MKYVLMTGSLFIQIHKVCKNTGFQAEMMKRLEELEQQELRNGELERDDDDNKPTTSHSLVS